MIDYTKYSKLVFEENFSGDKLDRDKWNVELHEPGWVNAELQEYVDSEENIYLKDGLLHLNPVKKVTGTESDPSVYYTSGRISTQDKETFTYGLFECRAKVPVGKGFLPAFWLMTNDESQYGQWPICGEIDCMEVLGSETKKCHGTIHYGNPHQQSQGSFELTDGDFSNEFHLFSCEWEPDSIKWYVDGNLYHEESFWYSAIEGQEKSAYPAPFNHPFYIILNLAVGGSWVGYPDENTSFENNEFIIDYVKVYQK